MRLSICIPVFNAERDIGRLIENIISQYDPRLEVIIFDGASTDNTERIVQEYVEKNKEIRYVRAHLRGGIDLDIDNVVNLACGEYCWLVSADDLIVERGIKQLLAYLETDADIYICSHVTEENGRVLSKKHPVLSSELTDVMIDTASSEELKLYLSNIQSSEGYFTFLSTPIFKRSLWINTDVPRATYGSCWIVCAKLFRTVLTGVKIKVINEPLIIKNNSGKSQIFKSLLNQIEILVVNFKQVLSSFECINPEILERSMVIMCLEINTKLLLRCKLEINTISERAKYNIIISELKTFGSFFENLKYTFVQYVPIWIIKLMIWAHNRAKNLRK